MTTCCMLNGGIGLARISMNHALVVAIYIVDGVPRELIEAGLAVNITALAHP